MMEAAAENANSAKDKVEKEKIVPDLKPQVHFHVTVES